MDSSIYVSMEGAKEVMDSQRVHANNLANVSTPGFKAELSVFTTKQVYGDTFPTRVYPVSNSQVVDFAQGALKTTGNELDIAINGQGWLVVQTDQSNQGYSRRGDLSVNTEGYLANGAGHLVLGQSGPISVPSFENIKVASDGAIYIKPTGSENGASVEIGRLRLVNPDLNTLAKKFDGTFESLDKNGNVVLAEPDSKVGVKSGVLETSNVNSVSELIDLIGLSRSYELDVKMMQTSKDLDASLAQLMQ